MRRCLVLVFLVAAGCGTNPGRNPDPVEIQGRVILKQQKVNGVTLQLQPTGNGLPASMRVQNGMIQGPLTPGKYTYYLGEGGDAAAFEAIPARYRAGSLERQIEITTGGTVDFRFE